MHINFYSGPLMHVFTLTLGTTDYILFSIIICLYCDITLQSPLSQATIMVYQAVAEYWSVAKEPDYNLDVELKVPGRAAPYNYRFTRDNHYTTRTSNVIHPTKILFDHLCLC